MPFLFYLVAFNEIQKEERIMNSKKENSDSEKLDSEKERRRRYLDSLKLKGPRSADFYFKGGDSRGEGWKHVIIRSAEIYHSNEYPRLKWVDFHSSINIEKDVWVDYPLTFSLNKENNEEFAEFISAVFEEAKDTVDIQEFIGRELLVNYRINWLQNQYPDGLYPAGYRPYRIKEEKLGGKENED